MLKFEADKAIRKFNAGLLKYHQVSKSDLASIINRRLLFVNKTALRLTPRANAAQIDHDLRVERTQIGKTGRRLKRAKLVRATRAESIIQGSRLKRGEKPLDDAQLKTAVRRLIASRRRAVGSLKRGWVKPIIILSRASKTFTPIEKLPNVKQRGRAWPARAGWHPVATSQYSLRIERDGQMVVHPRVQAAAIQALRIETKEMGREVGRRLKKNFKRIP